MKKTTPYFLLFILPFLIAFHSTLIHIDWSNLRDVIFKDKYYEEFDQYLLHPTFGQSVKDLENKEVQISGYIIPIEPQRYILSENPFSSCFFCGGAGPETVLELEMKSYDKTYFTDQYLSFKGVFKLNIDDIDKLNYLLQSAEEVDE
ncbi:MAG: DUF3299 domain-containing protein [Bacteroidota bacterium]